MITPKNLWETDGMMVVPQIFRGHELCLVGVKSIKANLLVSNLEL